MKRVLVLGLCVLLLVTFVFATESYAADDDGDGVNDRMVYSNATGSRVQQIRANAAGVQTTLRERSLLRDNYIHDFDALRYRYAMHQDEMDEAYNNLVTRIRNSDLSDEEKEALLAELAERKNKALERREDFQNELVRMKEQYRDNKEAFRDVARNFLDTLNASDLTDEDKEAIRLEVEAFRDTRLELRVEFKERLDEFKDERRDVINRSRELLRYARTENLTEDEREAVRDELDALRIELRDTRKEFVDEAKDIHVAYRGAVRDFIGEIRDTYNLSNGRQVDVKVMPDVASERAIAALRLRACSEENNCTIDFKEVGEGQNVRLRYALQAKKEGRFLGIFKMHMNVESDVDAETGEVVRTKKPWFAFLVNE